MNPSDRLSVEARAFADKVYICEPPCDSYGVCAPCVELNNFEAGYEFGHRAGLAEADRLARVIQTKIDAQAEDEGLWSTPWEGLQPIAEAYLQQELRSLHAVIEQAIAQFKRAKGDV